jgi:xanthine dehydrogenase YagR molybdenum-binding subunit
MNAIGQPISRIDGRLKVTGAARYTADIPIADVVYGVIVQSMIRTAGRSPSIPRQQNRLPEHWRCSRMATCPA